MKTIDNFNITPERILKDEDLIQLKGGIKQYACKCTGSNSYWYTSGTYTEVHDMIIDRCGSNVGGSCEAVGV